MTLGGIVILLLLVVSLIIFIYLIVISVRGWGVLHTILLCFLFIECWVFLVFSAGVHARRLAWMKQAADLEKKVVAIEATIKENTWGGSGDKPFAVAAQGELRRLTADRGRVWRKLDLVSQDSGSFKLEMSTAAPAADLVDPSAVAAAPPAAAASVAQSLPANLVVYGFGEELDSDNRPLPKHFLGEFKVTESQGVQVTVKPTLQLDPSQIELITNGGAPTWALYELLPLDSHTAFVAPGSKPEDNEIFGRTDEAMISKLFEGIPEGRREKIIQDYMRDGQRAGDTDPPSSRWVRVKLLKEYTIDVDSEQDAIATELGFFDKSGRSIDARLKRTEEGGVKLSPDLNERIVLKSEAADKLISEGYAELIEPVFVRPLNDYEEAFNRTFVRRHEIRERTALCLRDTAELAKANLAGQEMVSFRQIENQLLASDRQNYDKEVEVLKTEVGLTAERLSTVKSRLSQMYREIQSRSSNVAR